MISRLVLWLNSLTIGQGIGLVASVVFFMGAAFVIFCSWKWRHEQF